MSILSARDIWIGDEGCLQELTRVVENFNKNQVEYKNYSEEGYPNPIEYETKNGVAVISIRGGTFSKTSWVTRYLGIPTYEDIKERFAQALNDLEVKQIAMFIDSPGGMAKGVKPLSAFIRKAAGLKGVTTFNESSMASAALWYGTAATEVVSDEDSKTGSLGAISVHSSYVRMRKEMGIDDTVMRTAENKALGHPYEELTDRAKQKMMEELKVLHDSFVDGIALNRELSSDMVSSKVATGDMFDAQTAKKLGLVDRVDTAEGVLYSLSKKAAKASSQSGKPVKLSEDSEMSKKTTLSAAVLAALASGVSLEQAELAEKGGAADLEAEVGMEGKVEDALDTESKVEGTKENTDLSEETKVSNDSEIVSFLKTSLAEAQKTALQTATALATANLRVTELEAKVEEHKVSIDLLKAPVLEVTKRFAVACNMTTPDLSSSDVPTLLACFNSVNSSILGRFGIGRQSVDPGETAKPIAVVKPVPRATTAVSLGK